MSSKWLDLYLHSGWDLQKLRGNEPYPEPLNTNLLEMLDTSSAGKLPIVIPRMDGSKQLHFYLVGKDEQQLEEIYSVANAYLGCSYTKHTPIKHVSTEDSFEQLVLNLYPQGFRLISIYKSCSKDDKNATHWVMTSLNKVINQYHLRPVSFTSIQRPIGVILRHFFIATKNHDGISALKLVDELRSRQRLSPRNILSLEIQALAAGSRWQQIFHHEKIGDLLKGTIPRRLQDVLLKGISADGNDSTIPNDYSIKLLSKRLETLSPLFSSLPDLGLDGSFVTRWKLWAIGAVSLGRTNAIEELPDSIDLDWVADLREWAGVEEVVKQVTQSKKIGKAECLDADISIGSAVKLLSESLLADFQTNRQIYLKLADYPLSIMGGLSDINPSFSTIWEALKETHSDQVEIDNWNSVFQKLSGNCTAEESENLLQITVDLSEYWSADSWHEKEILKNIEGVSEDVAQCTLRGLLPVLLEWLERKERRIPSDAIEYFIYLLVSDEQIASDDLQICEDLLTMLLNQPHSKAEYINVLDCVEECWGKIKSLRSVDLILEVFEVLIDLPCADENKRLKSWLLVQATLVNLWGRLEKHQQQLCIEIAQYIVGDISALPVLPKAEQVKDKGKTNMGGKCLAIYTLLEGAGKRAKTILTTEFPGLEVIVNHDKTATDALLNLAKTADYFIFSSRSAAHQAFYPVSKKRKDLIYPEGKGTSSIVRAFKEVL